MNNMNKFSPFKRRSYAKKIKADDQDDVGEDEGLSLGNRHLEAFESQETLLEKFNKTQGSAEVPKKSKLADVVSPTTMLISSLPHGFYESALTRYFSQYGRVIGVEVARSARNGKSKGYGFVKFLNHDVAKIAADSMNNTLLCNKIIKCKVINEDRRLRNSSSLTDENCPGTFNRIINQIEMDKSENVSTVTRKQQRLVKKYKNLKFLPSNVKQSLRHMKNESSMQMRNARYIKRMSSAMEMKSEDVSAKKQKTEDLVPIKDTLVDSSKTNIHPCANEATTQVRSLSSILDGIGIQYLTARERTYRSRQLYIIKTLKKKKLQLDNQAKKIKKSNLNAKEKADKLNKIKREKVLVAWRDKKTKNKKRRDQKGKNPKRAASKKIFNKTGNKPRGTIKEKKTK